MRLDREQRQIAEMMADIESMLNETQMKVYRAMSTLHLQELYDRYENVPRATFREWLEGYLEGYGHGIINHKNIDSMTVDD